MRLLVGGEIADVSGDNEISVVSDDLGEEDTTDKRGDEGSSGGRSAEGEEGLATFRSISPKLLSQAKHMEEVN